MKESLPKHDRHVTSINRAEVVTRTRQALAALTPEQARWLAKTMLQLALVATNLKPGAFVEARQRDLTMLESFMNDLCLHWKAVVAPYSFGLNGTSYIVSNSRERLRQYIQRAYRWPSSDLTQHQTTGRFLGYPKGAIDMFVKHYSDVTHQHPFWDAIKKRTPIKDDIILALDIGEVIPAGPDDPQVETYGRNIRLLIDQIHPTLSTQIVAIRRENNDDLAGKLS